MSSNPRIIVPEPDTRACFHCRAWHAWDHQTVGREAEGDPTNFVVVGRQPLGQCRAAPPAIDPHEISAANAAWPIVTAADWCCNFEKGEAR